MANRIPSALWLTTPAALLAAGIPASAQVYFTEEQALRVVFGEATLVRRETRALSESDRRKLQEESGLRFPEQEVTFFVGEQKGKRKGYALEMNEIGKSEPITFLVGMSPEGKVTDVVVMVFRESRGWEVKEQRFLRQFRGKTVSSPLRINQDILNYSGATLSSKALARGVKRALFLLEHFYGPAAEEHSPESGQIVRPGPFLAVASGLAGGSGEMFRQMRYRMGTICEIRVRADFACQAEDGLAAAFAEVERLENIFSAYRPESELSLVNREAARGPVRVSDDFWHLTLQAKRLGRHSRGSFDVTVGPLLTAWGFRQKTPRIPSADELRDALHRTGLGKLKLHTKERTVQFQVEGMELDFGGLAKGYAVERASRILKQHGATAALMNLGGSSIRAFGSPHGGAVGAGPTEPGWVVGIADPADSKRLAFLLELGGGRALSTSGTYEQQFRIGEKTYSHVINPLTGRPLAELSSASVLARSGVVAEAMSKQLLISGSGPGFHGVDWVSLEAQGKGHTAVHSRVVRAVVLKPLDTA